LLEKVVEIISRFCATLSAIGCVTNHGKCMDESCHISKWIVLTCHMTHWVMWMSHAAHLNESHHTYEWVVYIYMSHAMHMNESCDTYKWVMWYTWMSHVTYTNEPRDTYNWVMLHVWRSPVTHMGWLRLVGFLKLKVFFAEYSLFYRAHLPKRPVILRSLLIVSTSYQKVMPHIWMS